MTHPELPATTFIVTSSRHRDESRLGFALRLADANGYTSSSILQKVLEQRTCASIRLAPEIAADKVALTALAQLADITASSLTEFSWNLIASAAGDYFNIYGASIPADAVMTSHAQMCPQCIEESGYIKEHWDLSAVTVCPHHQVALLDRCPECQKMLRPVRIPLASCSYCQADLRFAVTDKVDLAEIALNENLAALAPYRLKVMNDVIVDTPESFFALVQLFSFDTADVLNEKWRPSHFRNLPVKQRRCALTHLVAAHDKSAIDGLALHQQLLKHVAHRIPYMPEEQAVEPLIRFLRSSAFLSPDACQVLSYGGKSIVGTTAAEKFNGRPPQLHSTEEVMDFLGCSEETFRWLLNKEYVQLPMYDFGFDADEILDAQSRLALFLTFDELDQRCGVPGLTQRMIDWRILHDATGHRHTCRVVDMLDMGKVLDQLRIQSIDDAGTSEHKWVRVADTDLAQTDLAEAYALVFARSRRSDMSGLDWRPPYRLGDLWITMPDAIRMTTAAGNAQ